MYSSKTFWVLMVEILNQKDVNQKTEISSSIIVIRRTHKEKMVLVFWSGRLQNVHSLQMFSYGIENQTFSKCSCSGFTV